MSVHAGLAGSSSSQKASGVVSSVLPSVALRAFSPFRSSRGKVFVFLGFTPSSLEATGRRDFDFVAAGGSAAASAASAAFRGRSNSRIQVHPGNYADVSPLICSAAATSE
ncbi:hypothetical protein AB1Y20_022933 [Prymnesium parvum]|uniref:Uncharacterized protein n=1 Tax=Prymnesium parvum TaxID=97485 RepID=A0AB34JCE5_PRYPA